ncbi:hypothetical protein VFPFJ_04309 [Purpureocillium lilacinum]|uniref:Uncharacterized protein n=1 Tax=Purpureocillium lilacinum TaxID=33203 RepID=A0A179HSM7_PURLI|nr:hypothetical protein VFPFJ_04309 [Purpureocillium lilacinum]OAQ92568.1 hypothetical protein VFPFJ_04309 [Purpureocillium lilacinum]
MIGQGASRRGSRFSVEALERADSAMTRRCRAEECWSQTHHVRRLVSPIKPWSNPGHGTHDAHCINVQRSSARRGRKFVGIDLGRVGEVAGPSGGLHGRCPDVSMRRHSVKMGRRASFNGKLDARWMRLATAGS